jgi:broad specificity phosphatase PhoE
VTIHLTRHAHAGKRSDWTDDDCLRPLSDRGRAQALHLCEVITNTPVGRIVSSPFVRCVQTVQPIASMLGLTVEVDASFAEHVGGGDAYRTLLALDEVDGIACSHGDIIPALLRRLVADGMDTDGPLIDQKGSMWIIELQNGRPLRGRYVPPKH